VALAFAVLLAATPAFAGGAKTRLVSAGLDGDPANGESYVTSVSSDGRYVAFGSEASNLVEGDTNGHRDAFVRDLRTGETQRVSVGSDGTEANDTTGGPAMSGDGRTVAFVSRASNLVEGDTNGFADVFVHDRLSGETWRVNVRRNGEQANGDSYAVSISASGRFVAFDSDAANLVGPGDPGQATDIFVHDLEAGTTRRVTVDVNGSYSSGWNPVISADGRSVAFTSGATDLVRHDPNRYYDVFVRDLDARKTRLVSAGWHGALSEGDHWVGSISAHGRFVTFDSDACCLVGGASSGGDSVYVRDLRTGKTRRVAWGWGGSISAHGRYVTFSSREALVRGDTNRERDAFVRDLKTKRTRRVSVGLNRAEPNRSSGAPLISADGRFAVFGSTASNLVAGDTNGRLLDGFWRGPLR
jgi:Tol biopolymer transport system component